MQCEIGAKCNKGYHTVIRNGSQGLLDYVIGVGVGHKCGKVSSCSEEWVTNILSGRSKT